MRLSRTLLLLLLAATAVIWGREHADARERLALIIANQEYTRAIGPLQNPIGDALQVKASLERHGFEVRMETDATRLQILAAVDRYARELGEAGPDAVGFFYYAGHGAAKPNTNRNYIIPVSVRDTRSEDFWFDSVPLESLRDLLRENAPSAAHIVVFDACRNELVLNQRGGAGFSPVLNLGGMLTAFSASPGQMASDGEDGGGPYAKALVAELEQSLRERDPVPAATIFSRVRIALRRGGETQSPIYSDGLDLPVVFGGTEGSAAPAGATSDTGGGAWFSNDARNAFEYAERVGTQDAFRDVAELYPNTFWGRQAARHAETLGQTQVQTAAVASLDRTASPSSDRFEPGAAFVDCVACPGMVVIGGGEFDMGSPEGEFGRYPDEGPQKRVRLSRFAIAIHETTFAQWEACASDGYCRPIADDGDWGRGDRPVINVSWRDITGVGTDRRGFLSWLNDQVEGDPYRLPSEAEWEYAARAGGEGPFWWGDDISPDRANYDGEFAYQNGGVGVFRGETVPVDSFEANRFGLYNVHGNVAEWAADCWRDSVDALAEDGMSEVGAEGCAASAIRGGSWAMLPRNLRSANRTRADRDGADSTTGFRVARSLD